MELASLKDKLQDKEISWRIALFVYALDSFGKKGNLSHKRVVNLLNDCRKSVESRNIYWPNGMGLLDVIREVRDSLDYKHFTDVNTVIYIESGAYKTYSDKRAA